MTENLFRADGAAVAKLVRTHKLIAHDPAFAGELEQYVPSKGVSGVSRSYFAAKGQRGYSVDGMCELIWSAGLTTRRMEPREFLDWFDSLVRARQTRQSSGLSHRADHRAAERELRKAKARTRQLYLCGCGTKCYTSSPTFYATCALCGLPFERQTPYPEEIRPDGSFEIVQPEWIRRAREQAA